MPFSKRRNIMNPNSIPLPAELMDAIMDEVDERKSFLQIRLVSRSCEISATPQAFRSLTVSRKKGSLTGFQNLANVAWLAAYVKEIIIKEREVMDNSTTGWNTLDNDSIDDFISSIAHLAKFPNLNAIRLRFPQIWQEPCYEGCRGGRYNMSTPRRLQIDMLRALAQLHLDEGLHLQHFEIQGLIARPNESVHLDGFNSMLKPVSTLYIHVVSDNSKTFRHCDAAHRTFWNTDITHILNSTPELTSMTVISDIKTLYNWNAVQTMPKLKHFDVRNFIFTNSIWRCPTPFVTRHLKTLGDFDMSKCWVDFSDETGIMTHAPNTSENPLKGLDQELEGLWTFESEPFPDLDDESVSAIRHAGIPGYACLDTTNCNDDDKNYGGAGEGEDEDEVLVPFGRLDKIVAKQIGRCITSLAENIQ